MDEAQTQQLELVLASGAQPTLEALAEEAWNLRDDDPARAQTLAESLLEQPVHDPFSRALGLIVWAFLVFREVRHDLALERAFEAQALLGDDAPSVWRARLFNTLACTYLALGERALALETYHKQLACAQQSSLPDEIFAVYHDLGVYFFLGDDHAPALEFYEKAGQYLSSDPRRKAFLELNLAYYYADQAEFDEAAAHAEEALALSGDRLRVVQMVLSGLAHLATKRNDHLEAVRVYERILELQTESKLSTALTLLDIAESRLALGDSHEVLDYLTQALGYLELGGSKQLLARCHQLLSAAYKRSGAFEQALEHHERFHSCHEAVFNESSETRVRALEILHRTESLRQESERLRQKNENLERYNEELQELHERVYELSIRDALTGLHNRRYLFEQAEQVFKLARRYGHPLCVAMLDIDDFKEVNDTLGHKMGDAVLQRVGEILCSTLRETDLIARYGGEEFAAVMPNTTLEDAAATCDRLRQLISEYDWRGLHPALKVTMSIGIASSSALGPGEADDLFVEADEQLYLAKRSGRNRIRF